MRYDNLTVGELSALIGMSKGQLKNLFDRGYIRGYRIPGPNTRKFPVEYVFDWATCFGKVTIRRILLEAYPQLSERNPRS